MSDVRTVHFPTARPPDDVDDAVRAIGHTVPTIAASTKGIRHDVPQTAAV